MLDAIRDRIQIDVGQRGLASDPARNLLTETAGDFAAACRELAEQPSPALVIVTGFLIPHATPPAAETDGPLGALFLARALLPLGFRVAIAAETFCLSAVRAGVDFLGLANEVPLITLPVGDVDPVRYRQLLPDLTHLIALERVGPNHTAASVRDEPERFAAEVAPAQRDRCYSMRGLDITAHMSPAHLLFDDPLAPLAPVLRGEGTGVRGSSAVGQVSNLPFGQQWQVGNLPHERKPWSAGGAGGLPGYRTIGIGDGGNEIGMGKVPWGVVRRNINRGGLVACRVPTDHLIVAGISNWGAYGLAAGIYHHKGVRPDAELFDTERERTILEILVRQGPLVDGVTGLPDVSVDGLPFAQYAAILPDLARLAAR